MGGVSNHAAFFLVMRSVALICVSSRSRMSGVFPAALFLFIPLNSAAVTLFSVFAAPLPHACSVQFYLAP